MEYSVLIIDDDIWMQRILSKTLQSYGFKKILLASNGFDGIALAVENAPQLIILDILMPELSGHLTLRILKTIKTTKPLPVLMVSALSDIENLSLAVKSGSSGFISKPFTRSTVYEKLVTVFGKDMLDAIQKGEAFSQKIESKDFDEEFSFNNEFSFNVDKPFQSNISLEDDKDVASDPKKVSQDKLMQHYHEDEKKSIESIKKLLLKTKK
ncbi:MAG: two-component system, chemotaxis family, chemotaxis protein CheY [Bacteroidota bacterium]|nr:two-component system, chemotaxis family, chemotaxis protein CheY [Bacteroidota bacterium]